MNKEILAMKNILLILGILLMCWACNEDEVKIYDGTDAVYFSAYTDTAFFSLTFLAKADTVVNLPVKALGEKVNYDRKFSVRVTGGTAQPGVNYDALEEEYILKAGIVTGSLPIRLYKEGTKDTTLSIDVELIPNEYFVQNMPAKINKGDTVEITRQVVTFSNNLAKPKQWISSLGYFSEAKFFLFNREMGVEATDWYSTDANVLKPVGNKVMAGIVYMKNYLELFVGKNDYEGMPKDPDAPAKNRGYMTFGSGNSEVKIPASWPDADAVK